MNELTFIGLALTAVGLAIWIYSWLAIARTPVSTPDLPRIEVRDDLKNLPAGSVVTVSYDAVLTKEQRAALRQAIEYQLGQGVKTIILENGFRIDVQTQGRKEPARRRDDTRAPGEVSQWEDER